MQRTQPCPHCGCLAGWVVKGQRPLRVFYSNEGEIDYTEDYPEHDAVQPGTARCRHCAEALPEEK